MVSRVVVTKDQVIGDHVEYTIEVTHPTEGSWKFQRRYSALRNFYTSLTRVVQVSLPTFPPKKMFGNLKPAFIARRRQDLQNYFTEIVRIAHVVNSKEFNSFIKPTDKVVLQARVASVPVFTSPISVPDLPKQHASSPQSQVEIEKKYLRLVEDVSSFFINLASKSNPLEEDDVARKRREYHGTLQSTHTVAWGISPLSAVEFPETVVDRSALAWIMHEAAEVHKVWASSQINEVSILSKPV
mmetsp:Transcript_21727/g.39642  ORF Transcript_21727/g.39642 Transcript_21727/m.39642 type:complete len:242 (+) Transcript_21727:780-1505(+)